MLLTGPTAVGKTELSLQLATILSAEIISADSRQVYRYMDIGTAKPTVEERRSIPHHFINVRTPDQEYSAGSFGEDARACIGDLHARGKQAVVAGGSGFYIQALVDGLYAPKISDSRIKAKWRALYHSRGADSLMQELEAVDPASAGRLHPNDMQRIVRALEVYELTGRPLSDFQPQRAHAADFFPVFIGLNRERDALYQRIEKRVDKMIGDGLLKEVEQLQAMGYDASLNAMQTVGYREVFAYQAGLFSFEEMVGEIKKNTRRYAKRQMTWFSKDRRIRWFDIGSLDNETVIDRILRVFDQPGDDRPV